MQRPGFLKQTTFAGLLLALISLAIPLFAQQQKPPNPQLPDPNQTQQQPPASTQSSPTAPGSQGEASPDANASGKVSSQTQQSFNGKIVKAKDQLVLKDSTSNATYKLDRQDLASQYENKDVRVTGTLDSSDNTIRVSTIEPTS
jgi:predicted lipid-binding transport protein (Tim44 family)